LRIHSSRARTIDDTVRELTLYRRRR
jgi:hypothetical protein